MFFNQEFLILSRKTNGKYFNCFRLKFRDSKLVLKKKKTDDAL